MTPSLAASLLLTLPAAQGSAYDHEILAATGSELTFLWEVGLDDAGQAVFQATTPLDGRRLFRAFDGTGPEAITPEDVGTIDGLAVTGSFPSVSVLRRRAPGETVERLELWLSSPASSGILYAEEDRSGEQFSTAFAINDQHTVAHWVEDGAGMIHLQVGGTTLYSSTLGAAWLLPPELAAGNDTVVFKNNDGSILRIFPGSPAQVLVGSGDGFALPLGRPKVSHDGEFVYFTGNRGQGTGLFASAPTGGEFSRLAGEGVDDFGQAPTIELRDVATTSASADTFHRVLFTARPLGGQPALYCMWHSTRTHDVGGVTGTLFGGGAPTRVLGPGTVVEGHTVLAVLGQSRVNRGGVVVSTVSLDDGTQALVRATPRGPELAHIGKTPPVETVKLSFKRVRSLAGTLDPFWTRSNIDRIVQLANFNNSRTSFTGLRYQVVEILDIPDPGPAFGQGTWFDLDGTALNTSEFLALQSYNAGAGPNAAAWNPRAVNIYLVDNIQSGTLAASGIASFPPGHPCASTGTEFVALASPAGLSTPLDVSLALDRTSTTLLHEIGHYFGLLHTHAGLGSPGDPTGDSCVPPDQPRSCLFPYDNLLGPLPGDNVRDTPWDPRDPAMLLSHYSSCPSVAVTTYRNLMSYNPGANSRSGVLTAGQVTRMREYFPARRHVLGPVFASTRPVASPPVLGVAR